MKSGLCQRCRRRLLVVRVHRCGCGQGHRKLVQGPGSCVTPIITQVVRAHDCGRHIPALHIEEVELKAS